MKSLNKNWFFEGLIDFEFKKYTLLAYLSKVEKLFFRNELYPSMQELVFHYQNLKQYRDNKELMYDDFPQQLTGVQMEKLKLFYQKIVEDDDLMKEISDIINFALPQFKKVLGEGKEIYEFFESNIEIEHVGIIPLRVHEGYVLFRQDNNPYTDIYKYNTTLFQTSNDRYRGISSSYVDSVRLHQWTSYEDVKMKLVKENSNLPNPATFLIHSKIQCPFNETFYPIAKRILIKKIAEHKKSPM